LFLLVILSAVEGPAFVLALVFALAVVLPFQDGIRCSPTIPPRSSRREKRKIAQGGAKRNPGSALEIASKAILLESESGEGRLDGI
jgi:hypothetical protein